jgi:hypothetical protein
MRRQPVAFILVDAAILSDAKFRALARRLPDPDEFNSAVGAYIVALAAARRNGLPELDIEGETSSKFVGDLRAVGLVNGTGFNAGSFRAWAPRRPAYPSDVAPSVTNAPKAPDMQARSVSPPLYSTSTSTSTEEGVQGGEPDETPVIAWLAQAGAYIAPSGAGLHGKVIELVQRHGCPAVIAAMATLPAGLSARQYVFGAGNALEPIPTGRKTAAEWTAETPEQVDHRAEVNARRLAESRRLLEETPAISKKEAAAAMERIRLDLEARGAR